MQSRTRAYVAFLRLERQVSVVSDIMVEEEGFAAKAQVGQRGGKDETRVGRNWALRRLYKLLSPKLEDLDV